MHFRFATIDDAAPLAEMNRDLIRDEGHRNSMTLDQLSARMRGWLAGEYRAVVFADSEQGPLLGYALFAPGEDHVYLRQFFVRSERGRQGIGRAAMAWLTQNAWQDADRVRIDVLVGNQAAVQFWRKMGFVDYCLTMERSR